MKNNPVFLLFATTVWLLAILGGCSASSPSMTDKREANPGVNDIKHFANLSEEKLSKITKDHYIEENKAQKKTPKAPLRASRSSSIQPSPQSASRTSTKPAMPSRQSQSASANEDHVIDLRSKKITNKSNRRQRRRQARQTPRVRQAQLINPSTNNTENRKRQRNGSQNNKIAPVDCNQKAIFFGKFNDLTRYILSCKWSLPLVLRMNNITGADDFVRGKEILFPKAIYKSIPQQLPPQTPKINTAIDCNGYTAKITTLKHVHAIAKRCQWDASELIAINDIDKKLLKKQALYTITLPPALPKLRQKYTKGALTIDQLTDNPPPQTDKKNLSTTPQWCTKTSHQPTSEHPTIDKIAQACGFKSELLALLNDRSGSTQLSPQEKILLPAVFNAKVRKKKYQIPLDPKHCKKKIYQVEYGMSIGKISSTCQWNYKYLLKINQLSANSLLKINQRLILPPSLSSAESIPRKKNNLQHTRKNVNYNALCNKESYLLSAEDDLMKIAQTCRWDVYRLTAMNDHALKNADHSQIILLPSAIDTIITTKKVQRTRISLNNSKSIRQFLSLCANRKIKVAPTDENIKAIAKYCQFNHTLFYRLNAQVPGIVASNRINLPSAVYNRLGEIKKWAMPMPEGSYSSIYPELEDSHTFYFQVNGANTTVNNVQTGILIDIKKITQNSYRAIIQHADGYVSIYSQLNKVTQEIGNLVRQNDKIGEIAGSDQQLKYQLFQNGKATSFINI